MIARVLPDFLSDNSIVYNVELTVGDYPDMRKVIIGAVDKARAENIAQALNDGASWAELQ